MKLFKRSETNPYPRRTAKIIDSSYCSHMAKPTPKIMERECRSKRNCKFRWFYSPWAKCSAGCGSGYTKRSVYCSNGTVNASECNPKEKPMNSRKCESRSHCRWRTTKWRNVSQMKQIATYFFSHSYCRFAHYNHTLKNLLMIGMLQNQKKRRF